jgi:type II secretory pathway pseudopilin PulG
LAGLSLLGILAAVLLPALAHSRRTQSEILATAALQSIAVAEEDFRANAHYDADRDGIFDYGTLAKLKEKGLLQQAYDVGPVDGYQFTLTVANSKEGKSGFVCQAVPVNQTKPPLPVLEVNQSGQVDTVKKPPKGP